MSWDHILNHIFEEYAAHYDLLQKLLTNETNINNPNVNQLHLVVNLMRGCYGNDFYSEKTRISLKKSKSWKSNVLNEAR